MTLHKSASAPQRSADDDLRWMRAALDLARRGLGRTWPNPAVGCVIVKDGELVSRGWTQPGGRPHAEVEALARAGSSAQGATVYVTLEPCAHHGVTPPCSEALVSAGVARVVTAFEDPDPRVAGRGHDLLRAAGIEVTTGLMETEARNVNAGYLMRRDKGRPFLTLKLASTLDGRIATSAGESKWITGEESRRRVHLLRASHDAILVGAGTARADDPGLDVRLPGLEMRSPVRIVADSRLSLPMESQLAQSTPQRPLWMLHGSDAPAANRDAFEAIGAILIETPVANGMLDLEAGLRSVAARGVTRVFCEGGGALAGSLLKAGLVDRLLWATAGMAIGADGRPAVGPLVLDQLAAAARFELVASEVTGADVLTEWRPIPAPNSE
ncbi:MAG: bifunctional diaminohydroxyphosphoribosylaminopyrimidine deaminase/5-amino-6-(5-phosphoribosylamino)uracil reductase RibD [Pseudomonadota bacterium]